MRTSTLKEKLAMVELYEKYLHPIKDTEFFRFEDGWDDKRIAKEVNPNFGVSHARFVRIELHGIVKKQAKPKVLTPRLKERIEILEAQVEKLIKMVGLNIEEQETIRNCKK